MLFIQLYGKDALFKIMKESNMKCLSINTLCHIHKLFIYINWKSINTFSKSIKRYTSKTATQVLRFVVYHQRDKCPSRIWT